MTSLLNRPLLKTLSSVFPFVSHRHRLGKVEDVEDLGTFSLDTVGIVTKPWMELKDFPCDGKPRPISGKGQNNGSGRGITFQLKYKDHTYQFYNGTAQNRCILLSPRDFKGYQEFESFALGIIDGREYHLTRVDFAWHLFKKFFSVDFLLASVWANDFSIVEIREYDEEVFQMINRAIYQGFTYGISPRQLRCYDADLHNVNKNRNPSKMVNDMNNLEMQVREADYLQGLNIQTLNDLKVLPLNKVLSGVEFYSPSRNAFKNTTTEELVELWQENGLQKFMQELNKRWRNYDKITKYLTPLMVRNKTLKEGLNLLAESEHSRWLDGKCRLGRFGIQGARYSMARNPLFAK